MKKFNAITISLLSLSLLGACSNSNSNDKSSSSSIKSEKKATSSKAASSSVSPTSSKEELKTVISMPMNKENYQNLENGLLEAAKVDDIHDHSATMQGKLNKFNAKVNNILKKKISEKDLHKEKKFLTSSDYQKFKEYSNNLDDYLSALYDYAVKYQSNTPVINDDKTSQSTKDDYQKELDQFKSNFDNAKEKWSNSYDSIMNS
ncbi:hypothetical protein [Ligilactobacillus salivarius]|uniref:hypothetical protein n=1 Tax=Ligilactobacillus salivarius TaxID=1624 RepID=UPI000C7963EF|nr:hypothetical protein [Ligilactobacillus salivarius]PLA90518.1 hypothetical protein CYR84_08805 [Ligilactobacillus salivarius]